MKEEGNLTKALRTNSAVLLNTHGQPRIAVKRAHSYHLHVGQSDARNSGDLRQTTLRRGLSRVSSASTVDTQSTTGRGHSVGAKNKNIPMVAAPSFGRIGEHRWGTYSLNQPVEKKPQDKQQAETPVSNVEMNPAKNSVSPLTQVQRPVSEFGHRRNRSQASFKHEDSRHNRSSHSSRASSRSSMREYEKDRTESRQVKTSEHNSMFSLAPMGPSDSDMDNCETNTAKNIDEDYSYEDAFLHMPELASAVSVLDLVKDSEIASKVGNLTRPEKLSSDPDEIYHFSRPTTRTNQKVLDMRTLLQEENGSISAQQGTTYGSSEYAVRIQHEAISSQWTQIRLRFSARPDYTNGSKTVTCHAGVLGSIKRHEGGFRKSRDRGSAVTKENVAAYLHEMWHGSGADENSTWDETGDTNDYDATESQHDQNMFAMANHVVSGN
ncbi:hypothetical protein OXX80_010373 [Metschnikowia pulcherrima]